MPWNRHRFGVTNFMANRLNQNLALSIETSLGTIIEAYPFYSQDKKSKFYIAEFAPENKAHSALRIFGTIGISDYIQHSKTDNCLAQQEYILAFEKHQACDWTIGILADVCYRLLFERNGLCRGDVIGPFGPIDRSTSLSGFYVATPFFLEEKKRAFSIDGIEKPIYWLIPIYDSEFEFLKTEGQKKFEALLEQNAKSLTRLDRAHLSPTLFRYSSLET